MRDNRTYVTKQFAESETLELMTDEQRKQYQELVQKPKEEMANSRESVAPPRCTQCDTKIDVLGLAHLTFVYSGNSFCCGACLEEWLDAKQDKAVFKRILCLDFDGVCNSYTSGWEGADVISDDAVPGLFDFLKQAREHFDIQIYSSRSSQSNGISAMRRWFGEQFTRWKFEREPELRDDYAEFWCPDWISFPTEKPPAFIGLDDRILTFNGEWPSIEALKTFQPWYR